jgi:hypothetical protein
VNVLIQLFRNLVKDMTACHLEKCGHDEHDHYILTISIQIPAEEVQLYLGAAADMVSFTQGVPPQEKPQ